MSVSSVIGAGCIPAVVGGEWGARTAGGIRRA